LGTKKRSKSGGTVDSTITIAVTTTITAITAITAITTVASVASTASLGWEARSTTAFVSLNGLYEYGLWNVWVYGRYMYVRG
jgi:hypothetical protein